MAISSYGSVLRAHSQVHSSPGEAMCQHFAANNQKINCRHVVKFIIMWILLSSPAEFIIIKCVETDNNNDSNE